MITLKVVHNADEDADEALEDVGGAGLWHQKADPIRDDDEFENLDVDDSDDCDDIYDIKNHDDEGADDETREDVGWAGLWQKPDPIKQVHTCPQSEQDHA